MHTRISKYPNNELNGCGTICLFSLFCVSLFLRHHRNATFVNLFFKSPIQLLFLNGELNFITTILKPHIVPKKEQYKDKS